MQLVGSSNIYNKKWRQQTLFLVDGGSTIGVCGGQHLGHGGGTTVSVLGGNNFRVIMADNISWYLVGTTTVIIGRMFHPDKCSDNWVYFVGKPILNFTSERKLHL